MDLTQLFDFHTAEGRQKAFSFAVSLLRRLTDVQPDEPKPQVAGPPEPKKRKSPTKSVSTEDVLALMKPGEFYTLKGLEALTGLNTKTLFHHLNYRGARDRVEKVKKGKDPGLYRLITKKPRKQVHASPNTYDDQIMAFLREHGDQKTHAIAAHLNHGRNATHMILRRMVNEKKLRVFRDPETNQNRFELRPFPKNGVSNPQSLET